MREKIAWLVAALVLSVVVSLVAWSIIQPARTAAAQIQHQNNLKRIALAIHNYHDTYDCFPPAYVLGPDHKPWHSWRVLLLPQLGEQELYDQYRFDEPWNGPHNQQLIDKMPAVFGRYGSKTTYLAVIAAQTVWPGQTSVTFAYVLRGTANTILLLHDPTSNIAWSEPRDLSYRMAWEQQQRAQGPAHSAMQLALLCDGSTRYLADLDEVKFANY